MSQNIENIRVKELRGNMSLKNFVLPLGVTPVTISKIETGENGLSTDMAKKIAKAYNVSMAWLFGEIEERMPIKMSVVEEPVGEYVPMKKYIDVLEKLTAYQEEEINKSKIRQTALEKS